MSDKMEQYGQPIGYKGANFGVCENTEIITLTICPYFNQPFRLFNVFIPLPQAKKLYRDLRDIFRDMRHRACETAEEDTPLPRPFDPATDGYIPENEDDV